MRRRASNARFSDDYVGQFTDKVIGILNDYAELLGEGTEVEYRIGRRPFRVELELIIAGKRYDPFTSGKGARRRFLDNISSLNLNNETIHISERYAFNRNIISVCIPLRERERKLFKNPMVLAVIFGILCGLLCQHLPQDASSFIIDKMASPLMSTVLDLLSGIMGPIIFISMITSILTFHSVNEFTSMGVKVIKRFVVITLFIMAVSILVSAVFFKSFGEGSISLVPDQLIKMLLDIIPTNFIRPFLDNNTPQLVLMGFLVGTALLLLGGSVKELSTILTQIDKTAMSIMKIILTVIPGIPFLSIMITVGRGNVRELLSGWKFIAASYIVYTICIFVKAVKTTAVTKISISECWKRIKPAVMLSLSTGSNSAPIKKVYEISEREFNIKPEFTSFWMPMSSAILSPKTTVNLVIATFMMAQITAMQISNSFLLALILVTLELSLASPGTASAWAIMFETFGMPTSYVGLFSAYRLLTSNYAAAVTEAYGMLEEVEAAHKLGAINTDRDMSIDTGMPVQEEG